MESTIILLNNLFLVVVCIGIPLAYAIHTGEFRLSVYFGWMVFAGAMILEALVAPLIISHFGLSVSADAFPDGPAVVPALFCGWMWGVLITSFGLAIRSVIEHMFPKAFLRWCRPSR